IKKEVKRHRYLLVLLVVIVIAVVFFFGTQLSAIINFLTGHEVIVNVRADKESISLMHGEIQNATFESRVFTSLFCTPSCTSTFADISSNEIIEQETFVWKNAKSFEKNYAIEPKRLGAGQELYRFTLSCHNIRSVLCKSEERATVQNILVAVHYDLSEDERSRKDEIKEQIEHLREQLSSMQGRLNALNATPAYLGSGNASDLQKEIERNTIQLAALNSEWLKQDFVSLERKMGTLKEKVAKTGEQLDALTQEAMKKAESHNTIVDNLNAIKSILDDLSSGLFLKDIELLNNTIEQFNVLPAPDKMQVNEIKNITERMRQERDRNVLKSLLELDISKDTLCAAAGSCLNHTPAEERIFQQTFDANETCRDITAFNAGIQNASDVQNVSSIRNSIIINYTQRLPQNAVVREIAETIANITSIYDLALPECTKAEIVEVKNASIAKITIPESVPVELGITFGEPSLQCCVFGVCKPCCTECSDENFPVLFLHGHALSKDVSYEYSLDVFNDIQHGLEEEGYLNAGAISLYTSRETPYGLWGLMNVPLTIRLSYYFDRFQSPDNYVLVQTKSDNIDVYALRMKELIEQVQQKTGKTKVNIVAYSMGGLVARRYIQIFGIEKVDKLIMIGTPNHGVAGDVADYCNVLGEDRECKDMNADSLFINKLNSGKLPGIPIHNIVGTGCVMQDGQGDGVVLEESAWLDGATNHVVNGECTTFGKLHADLLEFEKHPEVFEIVRKSLDERG
ncbi:alpha/beta fold hydrolase, partial [Candidatus Woesearchaeota archaeon]|nr:alpha/beta fold hydrolase [Candidatus Woesearchaeota archaeon]